MTFYVLDDLTRSSSRKAGHSVAVVLATGLSHAYSVALVLHGVLLHARLEALLQPIMQCLSSVPLKGAFLPAISTLIPLVPVHDASLGESAGVGVLLAHAPPKEALAAVAGVGTIVLASGAISANGAVPSVSVGIC